ncbi:MAG: hypothetical protein IPK81_00980 [Rhodospirillales bacterium]|nr:MAG: hypothetical protein IPK81_00980 [Rhodospirillales bacterium]
MTAAARVDIRHDLLNAQVRAWMRLGETGVWWSGADRVAIAAETRAAAACGLCATRKAALSPAAIAGAHETAGGLPDAAVEAVHRIATDSGRLSEGWYRAVRAAGLEEGAYVELVSVVAITTAVDTFRRALGLSPLPLPAPEDGAPSGRRPAGARDGLAWVATVAPEDRGADDPDLYRNRIGGNVHRALSLVPEAMIDFWDMFETMYLDNPAMRDFGREFRAITHPQIEMLAARVAALNRCVY